MKHSNHKQCSTRSFSSEEEEGQQFQSSQVLELCPNESVEGSETNDESI